MFCTVEAVAEAALMLLVVVWGCEDITVGSIDSEGWAWTLGPLLKGIGGFDFGISGKIRFSLVVLTDVKLLACLIAGLKK